MREAVERFLNQGAPPSSANPAKFRYPELRLIYKPTGRAPSNQRAFAKFSEPGMYTTTVTQPAAFRAMCSNSSNRWWPNTAPRSRSASAPRKSPIPMCSRPAMNYGRRRRRPRRAGAFFPVPSLATVGDEGLTANSKSARRARSHCSTRRASIIPCADWVIIPAPTGGRCSPGCCSPTTIAMSISSSGGASTVSRRSGRREVVLPGNGVIDSSISPAEAEAHTAAVAWHRFQMPAYHIVRADGRGVSLVNIGVGPSNAKNITDHIAVLRPHCWLMVGHCAGLRQSQVSATMSSRTAICAATTSSTKRPRSWSRSPRSPKCRSRCRRRSRE